MLNHYELNNRIINNFKTVNYKTLIIPFFILGLLILSFILILEEGKVVNQYINFQKELFYYLNGLLSELPRLQLNLTQLGDALIFFPLISIFIIYAPKLWEALLVSSIFSLIVSYTLKSQFDVPRPIKVLDIDSFAIIGEPHYGYSSFPSGHSIATFVVITTLLFAFMPKKNKYKIGWSILMIALGLFIAFSRVAVGAHYPFDVIVGSTLGFIVTVLGIIVSFKINLFGWINNKKYYPVFLVAFPIWMFIIVTKILENNLPIFYLSLASIVISFFIILNFYVKKKN